VIKSKFLPKKLYNPWPYISSIVRPYLSRPITFIQNEVALEYNDLSLWYFISFIFGCAIYYSSLKHYTPSYIGYLFIISISLSYVLRNRFYLKFLILLCAFFTAGLGISLLQDYRPKPLPFPEDSIVNIQGKIERISKTNHGFKAILSKLDFNRSNTTSYIDDKLTVNLKKKFGEDLKQGDVIEFKARITKVPSSVAPYGYDFGYYTALQGINAIGITTSQPIVIDENPDSWDGIRSTIYDSLNRYMHPTHANFMAAILLGKQDGVDYKVLQNMRLAGISHILCISGLHLSLATLICYNFFRFLLNGSNYLAYNTNIKMIAGIAAIVCSYGYLRLSGSQIAATRAFIMCLAASLAILFQRSYSPLRALGVASLVILALKPGYVMHPSFQLSFLAVLALICGYHFFIDLQIEAIDIFGGKRSPIVKLFNYTIANIYTSFLVGIITAPVVAHHFHMISNYGALANLIAVPITTFILMPAAFLFVFLLLFSIEKYLLILIGYFIDIIIRTSEIIAHMKYSVVYTGFVNPTNLGLYVFGFLVLLICKSRIKYLGLIIVLYASFSMITDKKPDLILDIQKRAVGFNNPNGELEIYADQHFSNFAKRYWTSWFGKEVFGKRSKLNRDIHFRTKYDKIISVTFDDINCNAASEVTVNYSQKPCVGPNFLNINDLEDYRFVLVFCDKKNCKSKLYY